MFEYISIDNNAKRTLFLLHGTGGDKDDLLFFDDHLSGCYNLVGLQGNVDEDGRARFFRRTAPGVFDQESIRQEASKLQNFIATWAKKYNIGYDTFSFLGYSNGANMVLAGLFYFPDLIRHAALLHAMVPFVPNDTLDLSHATLFFTHGLHDPMVPPEHQKQLQDILETRGARVTTETYPGGHAIGREEVADVVRFLYYECNE